MNVQGTVIILAKLKIVPTIKNLYHIQCEVIKSMTKFWILNWIGLDLLLSSLWHVVIMDGSGSRYNVPLVFSSVLNL